MVKLLFKPPSEVVEAIANEPLLYRLHLGLDYDDSRRWSITDGVQYWVYADEKTSAIYGMVSVKSLTDKMVDVHIYILPTYWGTKISEECARVGFDYLRKETHVNILITACPEECLPAQQFIKRMGFKQTTIFKHAMTYNNKIQDLHQYVYNLHPEN